jgi:hypothetical protein
MTVLNHFVFLRDTQMSEATLSISITELIPMLTAIAERNWDNFKEVEKQFVSRHGVEAWEEFLLFGSNQH